MAEKSLSYPRSWILSSEVKQLIFGIPVKAWKSTYMSKFYEQLLLTSAEYELNLKKKNEKMELTNEISLQREIEFSTLQTAPMLADAGYYLGQQKEKLTSLICCHFYSKE